MAFVCVHNSCRSQIAEALGKKLFGDRYEFYSAGTQVKDQINQDAVRIMKEKYGIDMEKTQYSKTMQALPDVDVLISMGCGVTCPITKRGFDDDWGLPDPTGKDEETFLRVIEAIKEKLLLSFGN